jgi:hypothetical protein
MAVQQRFAALGSAWRRVKEELCLCVAPRRSAKRSPALRREAMRW